MVVRRTKHGVASVAGTMMNLMNCLEGMGILAMPYCMLQLGWAAVPLTAVVGLVSAYTASLLVRCMYNSDPALLRTQIEGAGSALRTPLVSSRNSSMANLTDGAQLYHVASENEVLEAADEGSDEAALTIRAPRRTRWTYGEVGAAAFGPCGRVIVTATQAGMILSVAVLYLVLVGSSLADLVPSFGPWSVDVGAIAIRIPHVSGVGATRAWTALAWLLTAPTAWLPTMKHVAAFSGLAVACLAVATLLVYGRCAVDVVSSVEHGAAAASDGKTPWGRLSALHFVNIGAIPNVFGIIAFAFTCHGQLPAMEAGMSVAARRKFPCVLSSTFGLAVTLKITFMVAGYAAFGAATPAVVSVAVRPAWARVAADILVALNTLLTLPLPLYSCVYVASTLWEGRFAPSSSDDASTSAAAAAATAAALKVVAAPGGASGQAASCAAPGTAPGGAPGAAPGAEPGALRAVDAEGDTLPPRRGVCERGSCCARRAVATSALRATLVLVVGTLAVGIPDFALVMSIVGTTGGTLISFVFPIVFYAKLRHGTGELGCAHAVALALLLICTAGAGAATLALHIVALAE